jgi:hypothetical protein
MFVIALVKKAYSRRRPAFSSCTILFAEVSDDNPNFRRILGSSSYILFARSLETGYGLQLLRRVNLLSLGRHG